MATPDSNVAQEKDEFQYFQVTLCNLTLAQKQGLHHITSIFSQLSCKNDAFKATERRKTQEN